MEEKEKAMAGNIMTGIVYRTLRENVVEAIRNKILNRELKPGMRIIEQEISEELNVSRGPIREAFRQLEQEGLVDYKRNMGCSVKEVSFEDVFEVYVLRGTYEILAVKSFKGTIPSQAVERIGKALEKMKNLVGKSYNELVCFDNMFHDSIVEETGMARLIKAWHDLDYATILSCSTETEDCKVVTKQQYEIHKKIYDAYLTNDTATICNAIATHYTQTLIRKMKEQGLSEETFKFSTDIMTALL